MDLKGLLRISLPLLCATALIPATACGAEQQANPGELDNYRPEAVALFEKVAIQEGAIPAYHYETLEEGMEEATAVVVAEVADIGLTRRWVADDEPGDEWPMIGFDLRIVEVLAGDIPGRFGDQVTVEFAGEMNTEDGDIDALTEAVPQGQALWLLRSNEDFFADVEAYHEERGEKMPAPMEEMREEAEEYWTPISFDAVFVQGEQSVVSAIAGDEPTGLATQGEDYEQLSELVDEIRGME